MKMTELKKYKLITTVEGTVLVTHCVDLHTTAFQEFFPNLHVPKMMAFVFDDNDVEYD